MKAASSESQPLRAKAVEWLMQIDAAPHDAELRSRFEAWLAESDRHRAAFAVVEPVWLTSADLALPPSAATLAPFPRQPDATVRRPRRRLAFVAVGAIAAAVALFLLPTLQLRLQADYLTGVAEQRDITLKDGSRIALDAGSAVAVRHSDRRREVDLLSGQAFFEVTPDRERPFVVNAGGASVTVTGTAFSVGRSASGVTVAVREGSVDVAIDGAVRPVASLVGGDRLQLRDGKATKGQIAAGEVASWRDHQLVVYDTTVRDVVEQLGRYRGGVIVFGDSSIAERLVSGVVDLRKPTEALQALVELQQGSMIEITPYLSIISSR